MGVGQTLFVFLAFGLTSSTFAKISPDVDWSEEVYFRDHGFHLAWDRSDPDWVTFEISAPTTGYVGLGFSPNGGMEGADMVIGWVDDSGQAQLRDLHGIGNTVPIVETDSDYELLGAEQESQKTTIRFRRKWNTCDSAHDIVITEDTVKVIWSYGLTDPIESDLKAAYHGTRRGLKNVFLKAETSKIVYPDSDTDTKFEGKTVDFLFNHVQVSADPTAYMCIMNKFPEITKKTQIIGWRPIIQKGNEARVHHILLVECNVPPGQSSSAIFEQHVGKAFPCYTNNMPPDWNLYCWSVPIAFTIGVEGEMYPENVGLPVGEANNGANYFMFEIHYDNAEKVPFTDNSGIRTFMTENVREFDMGMIWIGTRFSQFQFIPPHLKEFTSVGGCTAECTAKAIPAEGITATHVAFHGHTVARKMTLKHIRDGKELKPLGQDLHYDYNYQQARMLNPPTKVLPGDHMLTYCEYDTTKRDKPVFGGITTDDFEMCLAFLFYYPKIPLTSCQFQTEFTNVMQSLGVRRVQGKAMDALELPYNPKRGRKFDPPDEVMVLLNASLGLSPYEHMTVRDWNRNRGKTVAKVIDEFPWTNPKAVAEMKTKFETGNNYAWCTGVGRARIPLRKHITTAPKFIPYQEPPDMSCAGHLRKSS